VSATVIDVGARPVGLSICIVDDDADIRESLRFLLEDERYVVEEAGDGAAAIALLRADPRPRVMLLDRMMPRLGGIQTLRALATQPELTRHTIILFMSARHDPPEGQDDEVIKRETFATVIKPFDLDRLLDAVGRATVSLAKRLEAE
jgi:two-component system phosphate regulon response regulator PhoB